MHNLNVKNMDSDCFSLTECEDHSDPDTFFNNSMVKSTLHVDSDAKF